MTNMVDDFAATTTIGERVAPTGDVKKPKATTTGPSFGVPSKLEVSGKSELYHRLSEAFKL